MPQQKPCQLELGTTKAKEEQLPITTMDSLIGEYTGIQQCQKSPPIPVRGDSSTSGTSRTCLTARQAFGTARAYHLDSHPIVILLRDRPTRHRLRVNRMSANSKVGEMGLLELFTIKLEEKSGLINFLHFAF
ncbi:hypothetical protein AC578_6950 [Pseudocercospora eumusae]|uniref:Uncharacterized protein n=1 Tax=Pseudocercospora eumusae TaxID=321146 RepID=A0A139H9E2_9PEZI|nr:hypothetical protein AC578_6950 [Pseudocercospora eumusae]